MNHVGWNIQRKREKKKKKIKKRKEKKNPALFSVELWNDISLLLHPFSATLTLSLVPRNAGQKINNEHREKGFAKG